jgi:hypothetical protein
VEVGEGGDGGVAELAGGAGGAACLGDAVVTADGVGEEVGEDVELVGQFVGLDFGEVDEGGVNGEGGIIEIQAQDVLLEIHVMACAIAIA